MKKEFIFSDVNKLKGVGAQLTKYLKKKRIDKIKDIILNLPYSETDRSNIKNIKITNNLNQSFNIRPHKSNIEKYVGEKKQISDMWLQPYIDKLDDKQKEEMIMSSGLNNLKYTIIERKMIDNMVEVIKVEI